MKIASLSWAPFRLAFAVDFHTYAHNHRPPAFREGIIVRLLDKEGMSGFGEASPLPERGGGTIADVDRNLRELAPVLVGCNETELRTKLRGLANGLGMAATACALDIAALDMESTMAGIPLATLLRNRSDSQVRRVPVNAIIGQLDPIAAAHAAGVARAQGYGTIKLKVGMLPNLDAEVARVAAVRKAIGPNIRLRLDANGAWDIESGIAAIRRLEMFGLEWIEQPVPAGDFRGLRAVRRAVKTPIAADESVREVCDVTRLLDAEAADVFVIKPMVLGGLRPAREAALEAIGGGARVCITTTVDSGVATTATLHLAASLPGKSPACGLATGLLLRCDLLNSPLQVERGSMPVPTGAGLGITLAEAPELHWIAAS